MTRADIEAALGLARSRGADLDVAALEDLLRQTPPEPPQPSYNPLEQALGYGGAPTQARAAARGLEQLGTFGAAPQIRAGLYALARLRPEEKTLRQFTEGGGLLGTQAAKEELAREEALQGQLAKEHPVTYWGTQVGPAVGSIARKGLELIGRRALPATLRAFGAPAEVGKEVTRRAQLGRSREVAGQILETPGVNLRDPEQAYATLDAAAEAAGKQITAITQEAAKRGASVDAFGLWDKYEKVVAPQLIRSGTPPAVVAKGQEALLEGIQTFGGQSGQLLPEQAWLLRRALDKSLRGALGQIDPSGKLGKQAEIALRRLVDAELGEAVKAVGLEQPWAAANHTFGLADDAKKLAFAGARGQEVKAATPAGGGQIAGTTGGGIYARARILPQMGPAFYAAKARAYGLARHMAGAPRGALPTPAARAAAIRGLQTELED